VSIWKATGGLIAGVDEASVMGEANDKTVVVNIVVCLFGSLVRHSKIRVRVPERMDGWNPGKRRLEKEGRG